MKNRYLLVAAVLVVVVAGAAYWQLSKPVEPQKEAATQPPATPTTPTTTTPTTPTTPTTTTPTTPSTPPASTIPQFEIKLVGADGKEAAFKNTDAEALAKLVMKGGYKTSAGSIRGVSEYTAVKLSDILAKVGGMTEKNSLRVTASDGYAMVFTWSALNGNFVTFNPATGDEVKATKPLIAALAYLDNKTPLASGDGPLRLVILGEEDLVTEGHYWIKQVAKIEVIPDVLEWKLQLVGARTEEMDRATFESGAKCPDATPQHRGVYKDADGHIWTGIPVWLLAGRVDDQNVHETGAYNRELADVNAYKVRFVAGDGYSTEIDAKTLKMNPNILLANEMDGAPLKDPYWPLRLVGSDLTKGQMIRNIVKLELVFQKPETPAAPTVTIPDAFKGQTWALKLTGKATEAMTADAFLNGAYCEEAKHMKTWADADGKTYAGIPLWLLVGRVDDDKTHGADAFNDALAASGYTVRVIASDGYSKDFNSKDVALNDSLIVAFSYDGAPIAAEKAPLRLVGTIGGTALTKGQMVGKIAEIQLIFPG